MSTDVTGNEFLDYSNGVEPGEADTGSVVEVAEVETPADDGGQGGDAVEQASDEPETLDIDAMGDRLVPIVVDGQTEYVPLREATAGYQRQADYTRKSQEVARTRAVQEALENPATRGQALKWLQDEYGDKAAAVAAADNPVVNDPASQEVQALRSTVEQLSIREQERQLDSELGRLERLYGDDFDREQLVQDAFDRGANDLSDLERIHLENMGRKAFASRSVDAERAAQEQARQQAAANAAATVTSGGGAVGGGAEKPPTSYDNVDDAFEAAWSEVIGD